MLYKENCKKRQETFKYQDLVHFILEVWWYNAEIWVVTQVQPVTTCGHFY